MPKRTTSMTGTSAAAASNTSNDFEVLSSGELANHSEKDMRFFSQKIKVLLSSGDTDATITIEEKGQLFKMIHEQAIRTCLTKLLTSEIIKPMEVASQANFKTLADLLKYTLTMFIRDGELMDYKLVYAVLLSLNMIYARKEE